MVLLFQSSCYHLGPFFLCNATQIHHHICIVKLWRKDKQNIPFIRKLNYLSRWRCCSIDFKGLTSRLSLPMMHVSREPLPFRSDTWALKGSETIALAPSSNSFNKQNSHVKPKLGSCGHAVRVAGKWEDHRTDSPRGFVSEGFTLVSWCCNSSSLHIPFISQQGKKTVNINPLTP